MSALRRRSCASARAAGGRLAEQAAYIGTLEPEFEALSDAELAAKTAEFRQRVENGASRTSSSRSFAAVREAYKRSMGIRLFDVQLMGGIVLHEGDIAEMKTGEGKTFVATQPLYLNALAGTGVHLVTVNDYLAKRDPEWTQPVGRAGHARRLHQEHDAVERPQGRLRRRRHLRDELRVRLRLPARQHGDLARRHRPAQPLPTRSWTRSTRSSSTRPGQPLIISGEPETAASTCRLRADREDARGRAAPDVEKGIEPDADYVYDEKRKTVAPTERGVDKVERALRVENLYDPRNAQLVNHLIQALKAESLYARDVEYVVQDGEVKIVDEFTGRIMEGRRWSEGLHQAVEAKEGVRIQEEHVTLATITLQNYFRLYEKLAGMTGTAKTEEKEFAEIYGLNVVEIPTNQPVARADENDFIFKTKDAKWNAVAADIKERNAEGQPILVGTIAVETSEYLSQVLTRNGVPTTCSTRRSTPRARDHQGRGPEGHGHDRDEHGRPRRRHQDRRQVRELGGLYVLGTERHESRRIDNQLRGRSGRQGDPGETRFYLSGQDDLVRLFAGDRIFNIMERFKVPDDQPMEAKILSNQIEGAQKKVEEQNFVARKNVLKYDDVMNVQRQVIYAQRREVLEGKDMSEDVVDWIDEVIARTVGAYTEAEFVEEWDLDELT